MSFAYSIHPFLDALGPTVITL
uniref:Uncharacterized protein n=1 Tax=Rhizophora mucronata TaxID=61149 RepID=A0A2P2QCV1_RHIMU